MIYYPNEGIKREVLAVTLNNALRIAKERDFKRLEFVASSLKYDIDEFLEETRDEADEALYVLFDDTIVKVSDAWSEEAEIIRVMR